MSEASREAEKADERRDLHSGREAVSEAMTRKSFIQIFIGGIAAIVTSRQSSESEKPHYAVHRRPTHYTLFEGGEWTPWTQGGVFPHELEEIPKPIRRIDVGITTDSGTSVYLHAIRFETGFVWDIYNGWRKEKVMLS